MTLHLKQFLTRTSYIEQCHNYNYIYLARCVCVVATATVLQGKRANFFDAKLDHFSISSVSEPKKAMCRVLCGFSELIIDP